MHLVCGSISFDNAPVSVREAVAFHPEQQQLLLRAMAQMASVREGLLVCTCNRTEVYVTLSQADLLDPIVQTLFGLVNPAAVSVWQQHRKIYIGMDAVRHLFSVAAGLESQIVGEPQILQQLKDAYRLANEQQTSGFFLHRLMHSAFRAAKQVHTDTRINTGATSISAAAVRWAAQLRPLAGATALIVGAGQTARLTALMLRKHDIGQLLIASRTRQSAARLAHQLTKAAAYAFDELAELLTQADVVFCATAAQEPVITADRFGYVFAQRAEPVFIFDLAVPRDVEPQVATLPNVRLYNIDDLNQQADRAIQQRRGQIPHAQQIIDQHVAKWAQWLDTLNIKDLICRLTETYNQVAQAECRRYLKQNTAITPQQMEQFAARLTQKFLHGPIDFLKRSCQAQLSADPLQTAEFVHKLLLEPLRKDEP